MRHTHRDAMISLMQRTMKLVDTRLMVKRGCSTMQNVATAKRKDEVVGSRQGG